jgi:hypothetical protein
MSQFCKDCKHYREETLMTARGVCTINPPIAGSPFNTKHDLAYREVKLPDVKYKEDIPMTDIEYLTLPGVWPSVYADNECGQWMQRHIIM